MKDYTSTEPVFSESIPIVEENDLVNAENNNAAPKQLLQNILAMRAMMVTKEEGKSLVSDEEKSIWNMIYQQATGYTDLKIADLINGAPATLDTIGEIAAAMGENKDVVEALELAIGMKANQAEMESLLGTKLEKTGDSKDNTISFTSSDTTTPSGWTDVGVLQSGETHKSFAQKVSTMFKNIRYLWKLCGNNDISKLGDGTITGALNSLNTGLAGKAASSHTHDDRYYTESEIDTKLNGKAASSHTHTKSQITDFPTYGVATLESDGLMSALDKQQISTIYLNYVQSVNGNGFTKIFSFAKYSDSNNAMVGVNGGNYIIPLISNSDKRIKKNIKNADVKALDIINSIHHASYDFKYSEFGNHTDIGYIAQELIKLVPEAVISVPQDKEKFGYDELYQINYMALIPYLTKAIQELSEKVNAMT